MSGETVSIENTDDGEHGAEKPHDLHEQADEVAEDDPHKVEKLTNAGRDEDMGAGSE